jgi:hypothetical protein
MRDIDSTVIEQLQAEELRPFILVDMNIEGTHYRYTDCDVPISYGGNLYDPLGFQINPIQYSTSRIVDQVEVEIDNLNSVMTSLFVGGTPQGSTVVVKLVVYTLSASVIWASGIVWQAGIQWMPSLLQEAGSVTLFEGEIDSWTLDEERLRMTVTSIFSRWSQRTLSRHSASCRWKKFKGTECGYSGTAEWCDRTYARCQALGNTANFGGFRFLPSIIGREIWWGRTPK